jgi:hypothetical protein
VNAAASVVWVERSETIENPAVGFTLRLDKKRLIGWIAAMRPSS